MPELKYKRILLKLSGEAISGQTGFGINPDEIATIAERIREVADLGVEVVVVIGGGNLWRGRVGLERGMDRATADYMGMLATVMNGLALQDSLEHMDVVTRVQTAIDMRAVAEPFIRRRAIRHLEKGRVVILAAGTGNPYFTTDTAGALRAMELNCDVLIKATKVDGVYDSDPNKNPAARRYSHLSFLDALNQRLQALDSTAISLCMEHDMPVLVLNLWAEDSLRRAIAGEQVGTLITNDQSQLDD